MTVKWIDNSFTSLKKQPTFGDATTDFPAKWRLRNERRNSILMTRHYPDLGSTSDWSCRVGNLIQLIRSTTSDHPRRPRGSQLSREKRRDESFQAWAEEPLGTDSHRTISKRSRECWFPIGHKKCFVSSAQSANSFSWILFVSSYTKVIISPQLPGLLYISLPSLHDYNVKMPNFTFCEGRKQAMTKFSYSPGFINFNMVDRNSASEELVCIQVYKVNELA